jgi:hypothetical protein
MGEAYSPWRALRPVLLAGAAALSWLTFSSTQASADTLTDTSSLLGGVTGSIASVTEKVVPAVPAAPAPPPAADAAAGLLQPVVGHLSGAADAVVSSVPVVNQVVPSGTVSTVASPVTRVLDDATTAVVETVVPPVADAVPVLEPVLQPVSDLMTGSAPLPVQVPELPAAASEVELLSVTAAESIDVPDGTNQVVDGAPLEANPIGFAAEQASAGANSSQGLPALTAGLPVAVSAAPSMSGGQPADSDPSSGPALVPASPGSGTGSAGSTGSSTGSAAWLSIFGFLPPCAGSERSGEAAENAPAPVSFDPGSSPD